MTKNTGKLVSSDKKELDMFFKLLAGEREGISIAGLFEQSSLDIEEVMKCYLQIKNLEAKQAKGPTDAELEIMRCEVESPSTNNKSLESKLDMAEELWRK